MEPFLIIACIVLPLAAYALGRWQQNTDDGNLFEHYKTEIARLQQSEDDLRQSLYHRIGFKPERKTEAAVSSETPDRAQPNNSIDDKEHKAEGFPDLMKRRETAFAEDYKKFKNAQAG